MDNYLIIGIDPGRNGGISFFSQTKTVSAVKMPETRKQTFEFFSSLKQHSERNNEKPLVFIEKVNLFNSDKETPGKDFGIMKLLGNFESLQTCLEILEIPFVLVPSQTWQKELNLKNQKGEEKKERKKRYAELARAFFPELKVTLQTADALCLLIFGKKKLKLNPDWVSERLQMNETDLFS